MWASIKGYADIARVLIQAGADVSAADNYGFTAWQFAMEGKQMGILQILREAGVKDYKNIVVVRGSRKNSSLGSSWGWSGFTSVR